MELESDRQKGRSVRKQKERDWSRETPKDSVKRLKTKKKKTNESCEVATEWEIECEKDRTRTESQAEIYGKGEFMVIHWNKDKIKEQARDGKY